MTDSPRHLLDVETTTIEVASSVHRVQTSAQSLAPVRWDWSKVRRVLVVRLRSIGDTVLATPTLYALKRFLPAAQIDILLEDWVAPVLEGSTDVDSIITVAPHDIKARLRIARRLRKANYDVAFNLHGGSTAAFLIRATGATHRVGYADYRYAFLHTDLAPASAELWGRTPTHSVEQQLALVGWAGIPVTDRPPTRLVATNEARASLSIKLRAAGLGDQEHFAFIHPAAAFETKRWAAENFAHVAEHLNKTYKLAVVAVVAPTEAEVVAAVRNAVSVESRARFFSLLDLSLPEVVALAARARVFVGNDSGIAHIAAAMRTPSIVVFGSSNIAHWQPWTPDDATRAAFVREAMPCAPCAGYSCSQFNAPECIRRVTVEHVISAIEKLLLRN